MKKILLGAFIATTSLIYAKESITAPIAVEEMKEVPKAMVMETLPLSNYAVIETNQISNNNLYLRMGISPLSGYSEFSPKFGNTDKKLTDGSPDSLGYEIGAEFTRNLTKNFELGAGIMYQSNPKLKSYTVAPGIKSELEKYDSVPVYLTTKYSFEEFNNGIKPYLKGNIGYSFNFNEKDAYIGKRSYKSDVTDGIYLALGGGIEYNNIGVDLMWQINDADLSLKDSKTGIKTNKDVFANSKITLGVSYKFNF